MGLISFFSLSILQRLPLQSDISLGCLLSGWNESLVHNVSITWSGITQALSQIKSNQINCIVTSPQHMCLGEWNSWERAPDSAEIIYI